MNSQIENLEREIANLKDEKAYLEERIESAVKKFKKLKEKKRYFINVFGDAIAELFVECE